MTAPPVDAAREWDLLRKRLAAGGGFRELVQGRLAELVVETTDPDAAVAELPTVEVGDDKRPRRGVLLRIELLPSYPDTPPRVTVLSRHAIQGFLQAQIDAFLTHNRGKAVLRPLVKWVDRQLGLWRPDDSNTEGAEQVPASGAGSGEQVAMASASPLVEAALASTASAVVAEGAETPANPSEPALPAQSPQQLPAPAPKVQRDSTPTTSTSPVGSAGLGLQIEPNADQEPDEQTAGGKEPAAAVLAADGGPKETPRANEEATGPGDVLAEEEAAAQKSAGVWTLAEQQLLEQALVKYAPWMEKHKRWRKIAGAVPSKTKSQCTARYAQLRARIYRERGLVRGKHAVATGPVSEDPYMSSDMPDAAEVGAQSAGPKLTNGRPDQASAQAGASVDWTVEQQSALDEALAKFPATMDKKERWQSIAKAVPGRSLKECVARFKHLRNQIRQQHDQQEPPAQARDDAGASARSETGGAEGDQGEGAAALPDLNPEHRGVRAILTDLHLMHVGWSYTKTMSLECSCMDCGHNVVAEVRAGQEWKDWCSSCGTMLSVQLNAAMMHGESGGVAGYFDLAHVIVQDLTQATFCLGCFECGSTLTTPPVQRARPLERNCHTCHSKLRVTYQGWQTEDLRASNLDAKPWLKFQVSKARGPVRDPRIVPGKPLPDEGTCKHYAKSHRWLRFPCCGRAFPCDVCHETESECGETQWATRQICGYCAHEQPYSATKPCLKCGQQIGTPRKTRHWEGGKGCRDKALMSNKDSRKFTNSKLKTQSRKADRVGPKQQQ